MLSWHESCSGTLQNISGRFMERCGNLWKVPEMHYIMYGRDDVMHGSFWKVPVT
jgi:hypothetical protein